jgi:hypothetical protein
LDLYNATRVIPVSASFGYNGLYTAILEAEKKYKEESRAIAIKIFFGLIAIAGVIYSYLHM